MLMEDDNANGVVVSRSVVRRKGVRKANSASQAQSSTRPSRGTERSKSASNAKNLAPNPNRERVSKFSRANLDASVASTNSPTSDGDSVGSYSLENESIDSKPVSSVKSQVERINKEISDALDNQKSRTKPPSRNGSRSSEISEKDIARVQSHLDGSDPLDNQKSRRAPKRNGSRSSEASERDSTSPHSAGGSPYLRMRKKASPVDRDSASPQLLVEGSEALDNQKSRRAPRRTGSKSSQASDRDSESPHSVRGSPYLRLRKKPSSKTLNDESLSSPSFSSPPPPASTPRSRRKKSSASKTEDVTDDVSCRSERRKGRSSSRARGKKQRSSSGKRMGGREKEKRQPRRSRTPKKDPDSTNPEDSRYRSRGPVSEDEILELLSSTNDPPLATTEDGVQRKTSRSRKSKSPRPEAFDPDTQEEKSVRRPRSNSSGALDSARARVMRRHSDDLENPREKKEKKTRNPPRRSRSNNIGVDSNGLGSFLKHSDAASRRKTGAESRLSGSKSVSLSGARTVGSTRSTNSRRRRKDAGLSLKAIMPDSLSVGHARDEKKDSHGRRRFFDEDDLIAESEYTDSDDDGSVDLDLATARDNFAQQNLNERLQLHLTKTDELLYSVFPRHVADALRNGQKVAPENHELVTIFFSDIVGFTDISAKLDPLKISDMLDRLYNSFDALSDYHDVFKVET